MENKAWPSQRQTAGQRDRQTDRQADSGRGLFANAVGKCHGKEYRVSIESCLDR